MAFNVSLFQFAKRKNSTAIPGSGTTGQLVSCTANGALDHLRPELRFNFSGGVGNNPTNYNYAYIPSFGRYYYIDKWTCQDGVWIAALSVDALASWRAAIRASSKYILRAHQTAAGADVVNDQYIDTRYPPRSVPTIIEAQKTSPWTGLTDINTGTFVVGIIGLGATRYYAASVSELSSFLSVVLADDFYTHFLNVLGLDTLYPEAKIAVNPIQYISTIRYYPFAISGGAAPAVLPYGPLDLNTVSQNSISLHPLATFGNVTGTLTWNKMLAGWPEHPDASTRGLWLDNSPWASYHVFFPPWGIIPLDPGIVCTVNQIIASWGVDVKTGLGSLDIYGFDGQTGRNHISRTMAQIGIDFPVSNIQTPGVGLLSFMGTALGAISNATSNNGNPYFAAAGGIANAVGDAIQGQVPRVSTVAGVGSTAAMYGTPALQAVFYRPAPEDIVENGRPVMAYATISSYSGYMVVSDGDISAAATPEELSTISGYLTGGFFNE